MSEENAFILESWFNSNKNDPYPSRITKQTLAKETNITYDQVTNWFKHRRKNNRISRKIIFSKRLSTEQKLLLKDFFKNCNYPKRSDVEEGIVKFMIKRSMIIFIMFLYACIHYSIYILHHIIQT